MRILVIGDVHLGANSNAGKKDPVSGLNTRLMDYYRTLLYTIERGAEQDCKILVFTGDIFEHRYPTIVQQKLFSQALRHALSIGFESIHVLIGNHDQQRNSNATTLSYLKELKLSNIHVEEEFRTVLLGSGQDTVNLIFMPYRDRKLLVADTYDAAIIALKNMLAEQLARTVESVPRILIGHMALEGTFFAEDEADLYTDNELMLPKSMFSDIDLTIMGHVHYPAIVSRKPYIAYVGSMEKRGAFESHDKKYAIIDTQSMSAIFENEPCRNIFEIEVNTSESVQADFLMKKIMDEVRIFDAEKTLAESIVKMTITIPTEDIGFLHTDQIEKLLYEEFKCHFVLPIKPIILSSRRVKDSSITEHTSDIEAFTKYVKANFDPETANQMIEIGVDIISSVGES